MSRDSGGSFFCDLCGSHLSSKSKLQIHVMAKHDNVRPYQCTVCLVGGILGQFIFIKKIFLVKIVVVLKSCCIIEMHCGILFLVIAFHVMAKHDNVRPYQCTVCLVGGILGQFIFIKKLILFKCCSFEELLHHRNALWHFIFSYCILCHGEAWQCQAIPMHSVSGGWNIGSTFKNDFDYLKVVLMSCCILKYALLLSSLFIASLKRIVAKCLSVIT